MANQDKLTRATCFAVLGYVGMKSVKDLPDTALYVKQTVLGFKLKRLKRELGAKIDDVEIAAELQWVDKWQDFTVEQLKIRYQSADAEQLQQHANTEVRQHYIHSVVEASCKADHDRISRVAWRISSLRPAKEDLKKYLDSSERLSDIRGNALIEFGFPADAFLLS